MPDTVYRLVVDMSTTGSLGPGLEKLGKVGASVGGVLDSVSSGLTSIGSSVANALTGAVERTADLAVGLGKVGAVAAGGAAAYGVAKLNADLEDTQISLAGILNAQGMSNGLDDAMSRAGGVMKEMRKDANALPGEFSDLINIFRMSATPG